MRHFNKRTALITASGFGLLLVTRAVVRWWREYDLRDKIVLISEGLRAESAKDGIVVTTVCPGLMQTGSPRKVFFKGQHRAEYA